MEAETVQCPPWIYGPENSLSPSSWTKDFVFVHTLSGNFLVDSDTGPHLPRVNSDVKESILFHTHLSNAALESSFFIGLSSLGWEWERDRVGGRGQEK